MSIGVIIKFPPSVRCVTHASMAKEMSGFPGRRAAASCFLCRKILAVSFYQNPDAAFAAFTGDFLDFNSSASSDADDVTRLDCLGGAFCHLPVDFCPLVVDELDHLRPGKAKACSSDGIEAKGGDGSTYFLGCLFRRMEFFHRDFFDGNGDHGDFMEVVDDPLCHICIAEDLASVFLHEDVAQDGTVDAKAHEGAQDIPVSDEAVPAVPFDGEEFDAKVYGAFIAAIDKGYFYSFSFVVTAEAFGRDGSRMRGNRLSDRKSVV